MELNVPKVRARASAPPAATTTTRARPPSMPHSSPHPRQMMSWLTSSAAATTTPMTTAPTSLSGWTPKVAVTRGRRSVGGDSSSDGGPRGAGESLALTTAALARLTAEQLAHQQQLTDWNRQNGSVAGSAGVGGIRRGRGGHGIGHRRIPTPSGPPPSMPISVRPVVSDGTPCAASFTPAPATPSSTTTAYRTSNNNNANTVGGATTAGGVDGRPSTPINQMLPHHNHNSGGSQPAPPLSSYSSSAAILSLQHRAARQRPLRWPTARRSLSSDDARCYSSGSSSTIGTNRSSSSCGTSSPLSTTMVRASEVDAEVLREEMEAAAKKRRETFGSVEEEEDDDDDDGAEGERRLEVVEQISGVEKSGRWCRVRRGFGVVGGARKGKKGAVVEREEGDLAIEGRNWVRNASGEQSLAGSSEEDGNADGGVVVGEDQRGREDSGVECEIRVTESSERGSSYGSSDQPEPEQLVVPRKRALLPSWTNGVVARKSPEQSLLDAVLEASKVSPLLQQQQQQPQELEGATSVGLTPVPGDDSMVPVGGLSRSETVIRRRARSVEGERKRGPNSPAGGGTTNRKTALGVGLGLNCIIGVGTGADDNRIHGRQGKEVGSPGIQRTPRTRRKTVALG